MSSPTNTPTTATPLGGTASDTLIHKMGYGLMLMTFTPTPTPDMQAFENIKTAIELTPADHKLFINSAEFYGMPPAPRTANLELVARFFEKYPELVDRVFLSVKGAVHPTKPAPDNSPASIRASVDNALKALDGKKKIDLFQCARVDHNYSIEDTVATLKELVDEGKFDHIGVSEVSAATLKRANAVHPIAAVEIEVSPWAYEEETKKVIATSQELGIPVIAYSPLGDGFLTGKITASDLPAGDVRHHMPKFHGEVGEQNKNVVSHLTALATKKGVTTAQLSLAWVCALAPNVVPIPGTSKVERVRENAAAVDIMLTEEEMKEADGVIGGFVGPRAGGDHNWA